MTPLFVGLPDDKCQSPHWGYVFKGKLVYHTADGDIEITDGEAYYVGPGHTPEIFPGTEIVEFSPTAELNETMEVVTKNMEETGSCCCPPRHVISSTTSLPLSRASDLARPGAFSLRQAEIQQPWVPAAVFVPALPNPRDPRSKFH